ncbi:MAG: hypothetical protein ACTSYA_02130 [Candidatus Kariarchaeaceae archaeon]
MTFIGGFINKQLPKPEIPIRYNHQYIGASLLGKQEYCEYKVHHEIIYGQKTTEEMRKGTIIHEEWLPEEQVDPQELAKELEKEETIVSFPVYAKIQGVPIVGKPDGLVFKKGKLKYVMELKTVESNVERLWDSEVVQSLTYCFCLDEMGLGSEMQIVIPKVRRSLETSELKKIICEIINFDSTDNCPDLAFLLYKVIEANKVDLLTKRTNGDLQIHFFHYDYYLTEEWLIYLLGFWTEKRKPKRARYKNQCLVCEFNDHCNHSLIKLEDLETKIK